MNPGKQFEEDFKKSIPADTYYLRLHDSSIGFDVEHSTQRFALKSPYDIVLCRNGQMYSLEQKSNKEKSMSFGDNKNARIKTAQVQNLLKAEQAGAVAGLVLNFRTYEQTYFVKASDFDMFMRTSGKKSINMADASRIGVLIPCRRLKVHYRYDISVILDLVV